MRCDPSTPGRVASRSSARRSSFTCSIEWPKSFSGSRDSNHFGSDHIVSMSSDVTPSAASAIASSRNSFRLEVGFGGSYQCTNSTPGLRLAGSVDGATRYAPRVPDVRRS